MNPLLFQLWLNHFIPQYIKKTPKRARMIDDDHHHHGETGLKSVCIENIEIG